MRKNESARNPLGGEMNNEGKRDGIKNDTSASWRRNFAIDIVALGVYLVAANPGVTGIAVHEWLGLGIFVVFLVHCIAHYDWIVDVVVNKNKKSTLSRTGNLLLDVVTLVAFMIVTVSGLGISGEILPRLGFYVDGYYFWGPLHSILAKVLLALLVVHVVVHWKWIAALFKRDFAAGKAEEPTEEPVAEDVEERV